MALTQKEISQRQYYNRKENGRCPRCGKPLDREGHYCSECLKKVNEYTRETREWRRKNHICPECGKEVTYGDDKLCFECRAKKNERRKELTDEQKIKYNNRFREQQKRLYDERKKKGICVRCGKRKAYHGKARCIICLEKDATAHRKKILPRSEWGSYGLCYICGKKVYKDFKVCEEHYKRMCEIGEGNRGNNDYWKEQNKLIGR